MRAAPFQVTVDVGTNPLPDIASVDPPLVVVTVPGAAAEICGAGLLTVKAMAADVPPPGAGFTTVI